MARIKTIQYLTEERNITIRNPEKEDASNMINHIGKVNEETTFLLRETDEFRFTVEQEEQFISTKLSSESDLFIIAEIEGKIIGSCGLDGSSLKRIKHRASLGIAVQKEFWGLGVGKKLMEVAINWAQENGIKKITLNVNTINYRAINLYERLGFEVEGRLLKDMVMTDGNFRNSYLMALMLE